MKKEIVDGSKVFSDIYTDEQDRTWHICCRDGGSVSLFATHPSISSGHYVVWDSLDKQPPDEAAQFVIIELLDMAEGINLLLESLRRFKNEPENL